MVTLTAEQQELVDLDRGAFLVIAPPGSGKTEVIAHRIVRLIASSPSASFKVLALSYTKNAAATMRTRVAAQLGEHTWRVVCATYHSFCSDLLRHYGHLVGVAGELTVYDGIEDRLQALAQGLVAEGLRDERDAIDRASATEALDAISRLKRELLSPADSPTTNLAGLELTLRQAYAAYELALKLNQAVDFDGILAKAHELLSTRPEVAIQYRDIYQYIMIDEAQDTSTAQYEILRVLCGSEHRSVFMVADPAQSIYAFRGASSRFVELFEKEFKAKRFELGITFRCAGQILAAAQSLLPSRKEEVAAPSAKPGAKGCVTFGSFQSERDEAVAVVDWLCELASTGLPAAALALGEERAVGHESLAVLARSRNHLREVLEQLDSRNLDYHFAAGDSGVFDSDEYRILLCALKVVANSQDLAIGRSLVANLKETKFATQMNQVEELPRQPSMLALASMLKDTCIGELFEVLGRAQAVDAPAGETLVRLADWNPVSSADPEAVELVAGDRELFQDRLIAFRNTVDPSDQTWHSFILELVNTPKPESAGFRILTVHAAKGLEFRAVAVVGLNEGSFPDFRNLGRGDVESEQRLMYVAVTRASRALWLSRPLSRRTRFGKRSQDPSRFLSMMGFH